MSSNSLTIMEPFVRAANAEFDFQIIGGVGSFVLGKSDIEIFPEERLVVAGSEIDFDELGQFRENGTRRDLDVLVRTTDVSTVRAVKSEAEEAVGKDLELSIFGFQPLRKIETQRLYPVLGVGLGWLADRYVVQTDKRIAIAKKAVFPFSVDIDPESLETWGLITDKTDEIIPIPHPGTVILNYFTRSISGIRPKDEAKVMQLCGNIFANAPEMTEWLVDGPGQSQLELARIIHSLRSPVNQEPINIGGNISISPLLTSELIEHEANMYNPDSRLAERYVRVSKFKSQLLHIIESQEQIVAPYQKYAEKYMKLFTGTA